MPLDGSEKKPWLLILGNSGFSDNEQAYNSHDAYNSNDAFKTFQIPNFSSLHCIRNCVALSHYSMFSYVVVG